MTGKRLGHFEIQDKLGEGGMGAVYRAADTKLRRDVAAKILPEGFAQDQARRQRFEREARAASALNHPNILIVFEIGESDGNPCIVTELIDGQSLRQMLVPGGLPVRKVLDIGAQVATVSPPRTKPALLIATSSPTTSW